MLSVSFLTSQLAPHTDKVDLRSNGSHRLAYFIHRTVCIRQQQDLRISLPIKSLHHFLQSARSLSRSRRADEQEVVLRGFRFQGDARKIIGGLDRKSTRLNSSHANISYAVF